jgi:hypothetical protein
MRPVAANLRVYITTALMAFPATTTTLTTTPANGDGAASSSGDDEEEEMKAVHAALPSEWSEWFDEQEERNQLAREAKMRRIRDWEESKGRRRSAS